MAYLDSLQGLTLLQLFQPFSSQRLTIGLLERRVNVYACRFVSAIEQWARSGQLELLLPVLLEKILQLISRQRQAAEIFEGTSSCIFGEVFHF